MVRILGFHSCGRDSIPSCGTEILHAAWQKKKKKKDTVRRIKDKPSNRRKYFLSMHLIKNFYCKYMRNSQNSILRKPIFLNGQKIYFFNGQRF